MLIEMRKANLRMWLCMVKHKLLRTGFSCEFTWGHSASHSQLVTVSGASMLREIIPLSPVRSSALLLSQCKWGNNENVSISEKRLLYYFSRAPVVNPLVQSDSQGIKKKYVTSLTVTNGCRWKQIICSIISYSFVVSFFNFFLRQLYSLKDFIHNKRSEG